MRLDWNRPSTSTGTSMQRAWRRKSESSTRFDPRAVSCLVLPSQTKRRSANKPEDTSAVPSIIRLKSAGPRRDRAQDCKLNRP